VASSERTEGLATIVTACEDGSAIEHNNIRLEAFFEDDNTRTEDETCAFATIT